MAKKKRQVSAQTKVKLSQAAKKRRRGPKGSHYAGRFMDSLTLAGAKHHFGAGPSPRGGNTPKDMSAQVLRDEEGGSGRGLLRQLRSQAGSGRSPNEVYANTYTETKFQMMRDGMSERAAHKHAKTAALRQVALEAQGKDPDFTVVDALAPRARSTSIMGPRGGGEHAAETKQAERLMGKIKGPEEAAKLKTPGKIFEGLPAEEKAMLMDPNSELRKQLSQGLVLAGLEQPVSPTTGKPTRYYRNSAERDRVHKYLRARAAEKPQDEAITEGLTDERGRSRRLTRRPGEVSDKIGSTGVTHSELRKAVTTGRTKSRPSRVKGVNKPRKGEFSFGYDIPAPRSKTQLINDFPGLEEKDYIRLQEAEKRTIFDEFVKNRAWAHETRAAKMLPGGKTEAPDRVTFFTTSVGYPNVSVPSDSLIGQYVIKRRSRMARELNIAKGRELAGVFPEAVRDLHIVEFGTGAKLGAEGSAGLLHRTGWRAGRKSSTNYGKMVPVGATILRDNNGQPIYDAQGNAVYSEGATRPFSIGTQKELGLRVFIG